MLTIVSFSCKSRPNRIESVLCPGIDRAAAAEDEPINWKALPAKCGDTDPPVAADWPKAPGARRPPAVPEPAGPQVRDWTFARAADAEVPFWERLGNSGTVASCKKQRVKPERKLTNPPRL